MVGTWWYWVIMGQCNVEKIWNSTVLRFFFAWLPQPNDPRAGLTWSVKKLIFFRLLQWQNDNIFKHQYILIHKEGKLHSVRNIWTGNVFLQEKPGSHTEHNVVLVDWTHCQVNLLIINLCIILQGRLLSNRKHSSLHMFGLALIYIRVNQASRHIDFLHTQTLAQMCLGTSNMNLSESQIGRGNAGEGRIIWKWFNSLWLTFCINWQNAYNFKIPHATNSYIRHYRNHNHVLCLSLYWWL